MRTRIERGSAAVTIVAGRVVSKSRGQRFINRGFESHDFWDLIPFLHFLRLESLKILNAGLQTPDAPTLLFNGEDRGFRRRVRATANIVDPPGNIGVFGAAGW